MKSKRWRRRNRKTRPEWVKAEFEYYEFPGFHPYRKHPDTSIVLHMDLRQLAWELRESD